MYNYYNTPIFDLSNKVKMVKSIEKVPVMSARPVQVLDVVFTPESGGVILLEKGEVEFSADDFAQYLGLEYSHKHSSYITTYTSISPYSGDCDRVECEGPADLEEFALDFPRSEYKDLYKFLQAKNNQ